MIETRRGGGRGTAEKGRGSDEKTENNLVERQGWTERQYQKDETVFRGKGYVIPSHMAEGNIRKKEATWEQTRVKQSKSLLQQL